MAETGTTETNAFGQVEGPFVPNVPKISLPGSAEENVELTTTQDKDGRQKAAHTYEGNDPNILRMLDGMFIDNYPHDIAEFGPTVTPVSRKANKNAAQAPAEAWRPNGRLVATFAEHAGAINRIVPSPDHMFFITGGDDGCVKVWDSGRLERNVSHRARQTHRHAPGARVVSLCFIENTHCFVSCATDGSVHIVKVDTTIPSNGTPKYLRLRLLREYQLPADEHAVWCTHFKLDLPSVMLLATNRSRILGIDLRTMTLLYTLENPVHHGSPTCFVVDRKRYWLLLGTSHGVLDLWDLRFKLRLKSWGIPGKSPIHRLALHPSKGRGKWVCVAGGTGLPEVTVWDLEKTQCREIYRASGTSSKEGPKEYKAWDVDEDKPEGMLGRFATSIEPSSQTVDRCVKAMTVGAGMTGDHDRDVRNGYIITGGADKKLRFWDLNRVEQSSVISGLIPNDDAGSTKPVFVAHNSPNNPNLTVNMERLPKTSTNEQTAGKNGETAPSKKKEKPPRHTVISAEQGKLLRSHLDTILDVAVLEHPYTMTVSVDRSGVIFVFQ